MALVKRKSDAKREDGKPAKKKAAPSKLVRQLQTAYGTGKHIKVPSLLQLVKGETK